jgi:hypothetical protein
MKSPTIDDFSSVPVLQAKAQGKGSLELQKDIYFSNSVI